MSQQKMTVPRVFLLEVSACHQAQTQKPLTLISIQRISSLPNSAQIGKGLPKADTTATSDDRLEQEMCTDLFLFDESDSLRLMLGLAKVRAANGCGFSRAMLDQYGAGYAGAEAGGETPSDSNSP